MLHLSSELKHATDIRLKDIGTLSFLDFRMTGDEGEDLRGLTESIRKHGLLQPVIVRPSNGSGGEYDSGRFELVCGRRRYAACERLGFNSIPCLVMNLDNREAFEIALVENVQRQSLNPVEEAEAFKSYVVNFGRGSVTRLAERISKSEEYVSHKLLLLGLPKPLLDRISRRLLNPSHAMELVWLKDEKTQLQLSEATTRHNLSLRQLRSVIRTLKMGETSVSKAVEDVLRMHIVKGDNRDSRNEDTDVSTDPWTSYQGHSGNHRKDKDLCTIDHAILVVRTSLVGVDFLSRDAVNSPELKSLLMKERQTIHTVLDELIRAKVAYRRGCAKGFLPT